MTPPNNGPSLETYIETRLNLLTEVIRRQEESLLVRINGDAEKIEKEFAHIRETITLSAALAERAIDKAESAQLAHNVASNEWRGTVNDFKEDTVTRVEFTRLVAEFAAFRLETSARASGVAAREQQSKDSSSALLVKFGLIVAVISAVAVFFAGKF